MKNNKYKIIITLLIIFLLNLASSYAIQFTSTDPSDNSEKSMSSQEYPVKINVRNNKPSKQNITLQIRITPSDDITLNKNNIINFTLTSGASTGLTSPVVPTKAMFVIFVS